MMSEREWENLMERAREIAADDLSAMTASWTDTQAFARALLSTSAAVRGMREALEKAGEQFRFYEREHQAKADAVYAVSGPRRDEYEKRASKAKTNKAFADMCFTALSVEGEDEQARGQGRSAPISTGINDKTLDRWSMDEWQRDRDA